nr:uncharacterized protein LOC132761997 isoform X1 [Anolis sagrei ordinatus]
MEQSVLQASGVSRVTASGRLQNNLTARMAAGVPGPNLVPAPGLVGVGCALAAGTATTHHQPMEAVIAQVQPMNIRFAIQKIAGVPMRIFGPSNVPSEIPITPTKARSTLGFLMNTTMMPRNAS